MRGDANVVRAVERMSEGRMREEIEKLIAVQDGLEIKT